MAKIYATLIRKGLKTLEDVPERLREAVRELLENDQKGGIFYGNDLCNTHY